MNVIMCLFPVPAGLYGAASEMHFVYRCLLWNGECFEADWMNEIHRVVQGCLPIQIRVFLIWAAVSKGMHT